MNAETIRDHLRPSAINSGDLDVRLRRLWHAISKIFGFPGVAAAGPRSIVICRATIRTRRFAQCSVVDEPTAAAIRKAYPESGELSAVVELRRHFPGIADNENARYYGATAIRRRNFRKISASCLR